jgi:hypothetical protein
VLENAVYVDLPKTNYVTDSQDNASLRSQYNNNGEWGIGHIRARCTTEYPDGRSCPKTVNVQITAVEGAKFIDPNHPPKSPQLLAWVKNLGSDSTADGFQPSTSYEYALVVAAPTAADNQKEAVIYRIGFSTDQKRSNIVKAKYGSVYACHKYQRHLISEADFQPCIGRDIYGHNTGVPRLGALVTALSTWSTSVSPDPLWFSCSSGCCTSSSPTF